MKRRMRIWYDVFLCLALLDFYATLLALLCSTNEDCGILLLFRLFLYKKFFLQLLTRLKP
jgi:hypothetical protein